MTVKVVCNKCGEIYEDKESIELAKKWSAEGYAPCPNLGCRGELEVKEEVKTYTVEEVIAAEYTLEPMECKFCGSLEVVFLQYVGDAYCEECGIWQLDGEKG